MFDIFQQPHETIFCQTNETQYREGHDHISLTQKAFSFLYAKNHQKIPSLRTVDRHQHNPLGIEKKCGC